MNLAIIDSGGANISSVRFALQRLGASSVFTSDPEQIKAAQRVILPGVGAAGSAMNHLRSKGLVECIRSLTQPVLGICLGMQLLFESSAEDETPCLGIIPGRLELLKAAPGLRVPHMGWNSTRLKCNRLENDQRSSDQPHNDQLPNDHRLMHGLPESPWFYFVHSYAAPLGEFTLASSQHGQIFSAVVGHKNFYGAQFHPERSAEHGAQLLKNFLELPCT